MKSACVVVLILCALLTFNVVIYVDLYVCISEMLL